MSKFQNLGRKKFQIFKNLKNYPKSYKNDFSPENGSNWSQTTIFDHICIVHITSSKNTKVDILVKNGFFAIFMKSWWWRFWLQKCTKKCKNHAKLKICILYIPKMLLNTLVDILRCPHTNIKNFEKPWFLAIFYIFAFSRKSEKLLKIMIFQNLLYSYVGIVRCQPRYLEASLGCQEYIFSILHDFCAFLCIFATKTAIIKISWKSQKIDFWPKYRL